MAKNQPGASSSKRKPSKKYIDSYTIKGTNKIIKAGDCVLMRPPDANKPPYVARVEKIETNARNNVKVHCLWYYRPEDTPGGRRQFHGVKELFFSDHYDVQSANTIQGTCTVHNFFDYTELKNVGVKDYYCRFQYKATTGALTPEHIPVYCKCEMPHNPDNLMVQCEECTDWYHPACVGMTIEEAMKLEQFVCSECSSADTLKRSLDGFALSSTNDLEVCGSQAQKEVTADKRAYRMVKLKLCADLRGLFLVFALGEKKAENVAVKKSCIVGRFLGVNFKKVTLIVLL
ncbi:unnamed protein product [Cochlearia groenlandica]